MTPEPEELDQSHKRGPKSYPGRTILDRLDEYLALGWSLTALAQHTGLGRETLRVWATRRPAHIGRALGDAFLAADLRDPEPDETRKRTSAEMIEDLDVILLSDNEVDRVCERLDIHISTLRMLIYQYQGGRAYHIEDGRVLRGPR